MEKRFIYFFDEFADVEERTGGDRTEINNLLGGKGGNLAIISKLGVPVPTGFTITTEACNEYYAQDPPDFPPGMWDSIEEALHKLEEKTGKTFGSDTNPLLVSCRSGARVSMPGMMDTVLNIGLNDETVQTMITLTENPRFVWDSYRRLIQGYGAIVLGIPDEKFEEALHKMQSSKGYTSDSDCAAEDWEELTNEYKQIIETETGSPFPQDPIEQVRRSTQAVFCSWNSQRAIDYRNNFKIPHDLGTGVTIMMMVFGNMGEDSATGVAFTRDPSTGEKHLWGDFLVNAQGEDVVAGVRSPDKIEVLAEKIPKAYEEFVEITHKLEEHFKDMQDVEFTIERGKLWMLQTRNGKRTVAAAVKIANDLVNEGIITKEEALQRITPKDVDMLLHPHFSDEDLAAAESSKFATGINASPGAGVGQIYFTAEKCKEMAATGQNVIMVRRFTKPDDIGGMLVGKGVITIEGGAASHAAVVARQLGIPAVVGCSSIELDTEAKTITVGDTTVHEGEFMSINGSTGKVYVGEIPLTSANFEEQPELQTFLGMADELRTAEGSRASVSNGPTKGLMVWANADTPEDAQRARKFGAEGIGLCRTEHMFLGDRAVLVQNMILAETEKERDEALEELSKVQTKDFAEIFEAMSDLPAIIRLIDPPLHEFLPDRDSLLEKVVMLQTKKELGAEIDEEELTKTQKILEKSELLHETNPMIGTRGVRLGFVIPGLLKMQIKAIIEGACQAKQKGLNPIPEIMVPLTVDVKELELVKPIFDEVYADMMEQYGAELEVKFGTMIEVPRACLVSEEIAKVAEFYSFGTNDLHQMSLALSRDDSEGSFMQKYYEWNLFSDSPFQTIDQEGVGRLMRMTIENGRMTRPDLVVGICGEHGGDPQSIDFCHRLGMNYVSCSPFRIPIARLAAAQALLKNH